MGRDTGRPMYTAPQFARMFITVKEAGKPARVKVWRGTSAKAIRDAARAEHPTARLGFGRVMWVTK